MVHAPSCAGADADVHDSTEPARRRHLSYDESDDHGSSVVVQVHPDAESMEYRLKLFAEKVSEVFADVDVESVELCGPPSPALTEWVSHGIEGLPVMQHPVHRAGFTRLQGP